MFKANFKHQHQQLNSEETNTCTFFLVYTHTTLDCVVVVYADVFILTETLH